MCIKHCVYPIHILFDCFCVLGVGSVKDASSDWGSVYCSLGSGGPVWVM